MGLQVARGALVATALTYFATLILGWMEIGQPGLLFLIAISSIIGLGLSAVACVVLQVLRWLSPS